MKLISTLVSISLCGCLFIFFYQYTTELKGTSMALKPAPTTIQSFKEIAVQYNDSIVDLYNKLTPEERVFIYYLYRAGLPGNLITRDQIHRHGKEVIELFKTIYAKKAALQQYENDLAKKGINLAHFLKDVETFFVYVWTNHGQYFLRESAHEKRTPHKLGLASLTQENLTTVLELLAIPNTPQLMQKLTPLLFDDSIESTRTVPNDISKSAVNIYDHNFTDQDYEQLPTEAKDYLNAYFFIETIGDKRIPKVMRYSAKEKYKEELSVSVYWLEQALQHAREFPAHFDNHLVKSLEFLIQFLQTGNEEFFKQHSIEWLKSSSRLDYNFGFIETYEDPKGKRGSFQAEVTIKSVDIQKLNMLLPSIEKQLPFPAEFKREKLGSIPNASINNKVFGFGHLGPLFITAAYCLPNYEEIRSQHGSKQIIYPSSKSLEMRLNPSLARTLFHPKKEAAWLTVNDPDGKLANDIWDTQCILHETLGHGSGRLTTHTFKEGENLSIGGNTYHIGDTIPVTSKNIQEFLAGYESTIEELRAEIIALYVSTHHLPALMTCGLMDSWQQKLSQEELIRHLIIGMASTGLRRFIQQADDATEIAGDHARANCTIMYYLIERGGLQFVEEETIVEGKKHLVVGLDIPNLEKAQESIKELMIEVQRIKSTGDGLAAKKLIETYGRPLRHPHYLKALKENKKAIVGDIKTSAYLSPLFSPIVKNGKIHDVIGEWPSSIFAEIEHCEKLMLSTTI